MSTYRICFCGETIKYMATLLILNYVTGNSVEYCNTDFGANSKKYLVIS